MCLTRAAPERLSQRKPFSFATIFTFGAENKLMLKIIFGGLRLRGSFCAGQTGRGRQTGFGAVCGVPVLARVSVAAQGHCCSLFSMPDPTP